MTFVRVFRRYWTISLYCELFEVKMLKGSAVPWQSQLGKYNKLFFFRKPIEMKTRLLPSALQSWTILTPGYLWPGAKNTMFPLKRFTTRPNETSSAGLSTWRAPTTDSTNYRCKSVKQHIKKFCSTEGSGKRTRPLSLKGSFLKACRTSHLCVPFRIDTFKYVLFSSMSCYIVQFFEIHDLE